MGLFYEISVNFRGRTLTLIRAPVGTEVELVCQFAAEELLKLYGYELTMARLALPEERPERWTVNPIVSGTDEIFMLTVEWEQWDGKVSVGSGQKSVISGEEVCDG